MNFGLGRRNDEKGIEVWFDNDREGNGFLRVCKKKGALTLEEIRQAVIDFGAEDYYGVLIKCMDDDVSQYYDDDIPKGDEATLYPVTTFLRDTGHVRDREAE